MADVMSDQAERRTYVRRKVDMMAYDDLAMDRLLDSIERAEKFEEKKRRRFVRLLNRRTEYGGQHVIEDPRDDPTPLDPRDAPGLGSRT